MNKLLLVAVVLATTTYSCSDDAKSIFGIGPSPWFVSLAVALAVVAAVHAVSRRRVA